MDIKLEQNSINPGMDIEETAVKVKEEREVIIESDWLPTKLEDEENEYYQEFTQQCSKNMLHVALGEDGRIYEQFTIAHLDEGEDYGGNDEESEGDDASSKSDSDEEDTTCNEGNLNLKHFNKNDLEANQEDVDKESSSDSKALYKFELNKWVADNYLNRKCPECNENLTNYDELRKHIILEHKDSMDESNSIYYFSSDNCGICKKCNQEYTSQYSRYLHAAKHGKNAAKLVYFVCKICNYNSKRYTVQKHILDKHPEVLKEFEASGSSSVRKLKCPLCPNTYIICRQLWYHFMDKHPNEYKSKLRYSCCLCKNLSFSEEELFLQHLVEKHEMNSWEMLNFRKIFDHKDFIACKKCNSLFLQNDTYKLLSHFLKHQNKFCWSCRFCSKQFYFTKTPVTHMCIKMFVHYEKQRKEIIVKENSGRPESKIKNIQEFEKYMAHVCPFCNKEFIKLLKWQVHLRLDHEIDTLKGLQMKVIENDTNKLSCIICHTVVVNTPEKLHAHRFQHLPYKPYKCLNCSISLNTFKMAVNHVLKRCEDEKDRNASVGIIDYTKYDSRSILEIQCSFCNNHTFSDTKSVFKHYEDEHNYFEEFFIKHSNKSMTCKVCHKQYVQYAKTSCFEHIHQHLDEKTFKCKLCLRSYHTFRGATKHLLAVHNANPLNKASNEQNINHSQLFPNKEGNINHITKLPQLAKPSIKSRVLNEFSEFISYACPECNESMTTQQDWHTHIRTQHSFFDECNMYVKNTDGSVKCPTCRMNLDTRAQQQQKHKLTHMPYKSFMCKLCYVRFNSLGILYGHLRRRHFAKGYFGCPVCTQILQNEYERTEHLKNIHPREDWPETMCLICYKILSKKSSLIQHMVTHDGDRFKYSCNFCGSKIFDLRDFNAHIDRHKQRGEITEEMGNDIISQSAGKSNDLIHAGEINQINLQKYGHNQQSDLEQLNTETSSAKKRSKIDI